MLAVLLMTIASATVFDVSTFGVQDVVSVPVVSAATGASYDAIEPKGRRREPAVDRRSEDLILNSANRAKLLANSRDIHRNYALAAWAVRRHLDYVASFGFQCQSPDKGFNKELELLVSEHAVRADIAGRHRFSKMLRILEARATLDGDCAWLLIDREDGRIQGIEGDRIRNPIEWGQTVLDGEWTHGVRTDESGRAVEYAIAKRDVRGLTFERTVPADSLLLRGYFDRFDQLRGVSPLASGLNTLRDSYENIDYALAKAKISQLFGFKVTRNGTAEYAPTEQDAEDSATGKYQVDFGRGPVFLDMDIGEDANFINAATPSNEFREFMMAAIMLSLKALDIPYSFFDESHTNFFGSRGAWMHYERSARDKREDNANILDKTTRWLFALWIRDKKLTLPAGLSLDRPFWSWIPRGMPWWKPTEEIAGALSAIGAGLDNPQRVAEEADRGDVFENIDKTAEVLKYAQERWSQFGMALSFVPQQQTTQVVSAEEVINGGKAKP